MLSLDNKSFTISTSFNSHAICKAVLSNYIDFLISFNP